MEGPTADCIPVPTRRRAPRRRRTRAAGQRLPSSYTPRYSVTSFLPGWEGLVRAPGVWFIVNSILCAPLPFPAQVMMHASSGLQSLHAVACPRAGAGESFSSTLHSAGRYKILYNNLAGFIPLSESHAESRTKQDARCRRRRSCAGWPAQLASSISGCRREQVLHPVRIDCPTWSLSAPSILKYIFLLGPGGIPPFDAAPNAAKWPKTSNTKSPRHGV